MLTGMGVAVERNDVLGDVAACLLSTLAPTTNARMCSCARRCMRCEGRAGLVGVAKWVLINADPGRDVAPKATFSRISFRIATS